MADYDKIQHGIDDDPNNDPEKARNLGGVGGAVTGLVAGAAAGPVGAVIGAVVGGVAGALGSQAAVAAVDKYDNDNTITGIGEGATPDVNSPDYVAPTGTAYDGTTFGNNTPGIQTGGYAADGTPDTRGITEKVADTLTGDPYDDKTGKRVDIDRPTAYADNPTAGTGTGFNPNQGSSFEAGTRAETAMGGNGVPGIQTGGHAYDGTPDTRGITEKVADTLTGDNIDDKTGKPV